MMDKSKGKTLTTVKGMQASGMRRKDRSVRKTDTHVTHTGPHALFTMWNSSMKQVNVYREHGSANSHVTDMARESIRIRMQGLIGGHQLHGNLSRNIHVTQPTSIKPTCHIRISHPHCNTSGTGAKPTVIRIRSRHVFQARNFHPFVHTWRARVTGTCLVCCEICLGTTFFAKVTPLNSRNNTGLSYLSLLDSQHFSMAV